MRDSLTIDFDLASLDSIFMGELSLTSLVVTNLPVIDVLAMLLLPNSPPLPPVMSAILAKYLDTIAVIVPWEIVVGVVQEVTLHAPAVEVALTFHAHPTILLRTIGLWLLRSGLGIRRRKLQLPGKSSMRLTEVTCLSFLLTVGHLSTCARMSRFLQTCGRSFLLSSLGTVLSYTLISTFLAI